MSRSRLALALVGAAAAIIAVIVVLAVGTSGKSTSSVTASPACLPTTLNHSAKLAGLPVDVSPAPETGTANPRTQISFLGVPVTDIHGVSATGERSGPHPGRLDSYSQGDGASFVPDTPFEAGERVTVHATVGQSGGVKQVAFGFRVDTPYSTTSVPPFPTHRRPPPTTRASPPCRESRPRF